MRWNRCKAIVQQTWRGVSNDDVLGHAAQLSFYFFLAYFPLMICFIAVLGIFGSIQHLQDSFIAFLYSVLPYQAAQFLQVSVTQIDQSHAASKLSVNLALLLWSSSSGMAAIMDTLNASYDVKETRSFLRRTLTAVLLTVGAATLLLAALAIVVGGGEAADWFTRGGINLALKVVRWPLAVALVLLGFALIYFVAPNVRDQRWRWVTPGTIVAVFVWAGASFVLKAYLHLFNTYGSGYGSLGAVIVLLLWFYLTGAAVLIGAELNTAIENSAAQQGIPGAKRKGESFPGSRLDRTAA